MRSNLIQKPNSQSFWRDRLLRFAHDAMATRFEALVLHEDKQYARQAVETAFQELDRLEQLLSRFIETSDIVRINHLKPNEYSRISLDTHICLSECISLCKETNGAFDVGAGAIIDAWKDVKHSKQQRDITDGILSIQIESNPPSVMMGEAAVIIDLGGYAKGYALDRMAETLREWDINCALIHGGMSTALALEPPPNEIGWPITISHPNTQRTLKMVRLSNAAFSGSGLQKGSHIVDPRTGRPSDQIIAAWVQSDHASRADALSTAFMVLDQNEISGLINSQSHDQAAVLTQTDEFICFPTDQTA